MSVVVQRLFAEAVCYRPVPGYEGCLVQVKCPLAEGRGRLRGEKMADDRL
jgi:hypothetical protein